MGYVLDNLTPIASGYYQISVDGTAKSLATLIGASIPQDSSACLIQIDENNDLSNANLGVRYREDGGTPTTTNGFVMGQGDYREFTNRPQIDNLLFISAEATSVTVNVQFYKS